MSASGPSGPLVFTLGLPDLDPNCLTLMEFLKEVFEKKLFEKKSADNKSMKNYPIGQKIMPKSPQV